MSDIEVLIHERDYIYIKEAVKKANNKEVGGLGVVVINEDGKPVIKHNKLLEQEVSSGEVEWGENAQADYLLDLFTPVENGGFGFTETSYGIFSWHSHGSMGVYWSGTDEDFIKRVGTTVPWMFSSVFNNKGASKHRLDCYPDLGDKCSFLDRTHITWEKGIELVIIPDDTIEDNSEKIAEIGKIEKEYDDFIKKAEEERDEKVKELREEVVKAQGALTAEIREIMDADYEKYVTEKHWSGGFTRKDTKSGQTNGGTKNKEWYAKGKGVTSKKADGFPVGQGGSGTSGDSSNGQGDSGKGLSGAETASDQTDMIDSVELDIRDTTFVFCYDFRFFQTCMLSVSTILSDSEVVPFEDIEEDVLKQLTESERGVLANKPTKEEVLDVFKDLHENDSDAQYEHASIYARIRNLD